MSFSLDGMPHRSPMRLISRVLTVNATECEAEAVIDRNMLFLTNGKVERIAIAEMLAQTFAAGLALSNTRSIPQQGFLVGLRDIRFDGDAYIGDRILLQVRQSGTVGDFYLVEGKASLDSGTILAEGQLRIYAPSEGTA